jgi:sec-independent protein translocase protein TatB
MKDSVETAARDVEGSIRAGANDFEKEWTAATAAAAPPPLPDMPSYPQYRNPKKNWRIKQGATPGWYKARNGIRTKALSGAARVARYRPQKFN